MSSLHDSRGTFEECTHVARINSREFIDKDPSRRTAKVSIDISNAGITFEPGHRVAIMPMNNWAEVDKIVRACGLSDSLEKSVPLDNPWKRFSMHINSIYRTIGSEDTLSVSGILRRGTLAPLHKDIIVKVPFQNGED